MRWFYCLFEKVDSQSSYNHDYKSVRHSSPLTSKCLPQNKKNKMIINYFNKIKNKLDHRDLKFTIVLFIHFIRNKKKNQFII